MDLKSRVNFSLSTNVLFKRYNPNGLYIGRFSYDKCIENLDEFREYIANLVKTVDFDKFSINLGTYYIDLQRRVIVSDEDDRVHFPSKTFYNQKTPVILSTTGKLLYASDIEPLLQKKIPDFSMGADKIVNTNPIYLKSFDGHTIDYRTLTYNGIINDTVIDSNLNELYPNDTGKPPVWLIELLSNTKEKVRF